MTEEKKPYRLSNSELQVFKDCRRKWWLNYYRRLQPRQKEYTGPLALGSRIHEALDRYYSKDIPLLDAYAELVQEEMDKMVAEYRDTSSLESEAELGRIMLEGYLEWVENEGIDAELEMISTEEIISMPLMDGEVELQGKLDMRVRRLSDGVRMFRDFKAQPLSEPVATPEGWTTMGELKVGDTVLGQGFKPTKVLGVYDLGEDNVYKITFNDGSWVRASGDHLWTITRGGKSITVKTTELIARKVNSDRIESISAEEHDLSEVELPIHPYLLGSWLSDGGRHQKQSQTKRVPIAQGDVLVASKIKNLAGVGASVTAPYSGRNKNNLYTQRIPIAQELESLGISQLYSGERYIPSKYLRAGRVQRLELLQGLMDGDGLVGVHQNTVQYVTVSEKLASDVAELVRSLGGWARVVKNISPNYYIKSDKSKIYTGTYSYRVVIRIEENPFSGAKASRWQNKQEISRRSYRPNLEKYRSKVIKSVVLDGREEVRCIKVQASDSLYITRGLTLTHNTVGGSFTDFASQAQMNEQIKTYMLLETAQNKSPEERSEGGIFTMLKKVKRTANARPPFYEQIEVRHNVFTLRAFWQQIHGTIRDLLSVKKALDEGADPNFVAYPRPTRDCKWKCQFYAVCPLIDDGSAAEAAIEEMYEVSDPYGYYKSTEERKGAE
jgi:intein/homing endonuclease/CRISPR/Cas system-associated exonuclease Cas4 (RecB family)